MQISANEVKKLLTTETNGLLKSGEVELEFKEVTADSLPKTVEPEPAEVARVLEVVMAAPDVREDLVMELKQRIEKGEYKVGGEEIADMMFRRMKADNVR
jgi:anti-sigma28 factor (negative regulator of flagellin synthesis)